MLPNTTLKIAAAIACSLVLSSTAFAELLLRSSSGSATASSWVAGAVAGYNWQQGGMVYGVESDLSGTALKSGVVNSFSNQNLPPALILPSFDTTAQVDWYGTLRGRLGWTAGPLLFYGTAGLAYGEVRLSSSFNPGSFTIPNAALLNGQTSSVRVGWVAGAGVDYMWSPNLVLKLQYQYVDLGSVGLVTTTGGLFQAIGSNANVHAQFQAVTIAATWRFAPPPTVVASTQKPRHLPPVVVTNPWEGFYVGGRVGGDWGNGMSATSKSPPTRPPT